jgi:hypothetical protein
MSVFVSRSLRGVLGLMSIIALSSLPVTAKTHRTVYTDAMIQKAKQKIATEAWAKEQVADYEKKSQFLVKMSDEELWNFIPPAEQFRALNVHFGSDCPVHGAEIHRKGGHYPWIMSRDKPFKVECPIGHEVYPSNDFKPWWTEGKSPVTPENSSPQEKYVDNGAGWVDEKGERYWFVAHYMFWQRWRGDVLPGIENLSQAYLLTGNPVYGHKCAVMLARLAQEYPQMDYLKQAYHHDYPTKVRGKILDYIWETSTVNSLAKAYDAAYPATDLSQDAELSTFLQSKGVTNLRASVEKNIITVMIDALMDNTIRGNMGMPQRAMAGLALVLDNDDPGKGHTTKELVDWILRTEPGKTTGETEALFYNGFYRDGHGGESSPGYSAGWNGNFYTVAKDMDRLGVDLFTRPKMKKMADILLDMTVANKFSPSIGDNGSAKGAGRLWSAGVFKEAWLRYRDPRYAQALRLMNFKDQSLWEDSVEEEVKTASAGMGDEIALSSRNLGGYGLAILETGKGDDRRAISMYYGSAAGGHGQRDRLTTESWFYGKTMMSDHGYPAHWLPKNPYWTANTISHYAVVVDKKWQQTYLGGHLDLLADSPTARVMEASAESVYPKDVSRYRHTTAMIDMSPSRSYLFDVWRVRGGAQHDWSFHGFPFADFSAPTLDWSETQKTGTLAGPDVKFAEEKAPDRPSGFQYLFNVQKATPKRTFLSEWKSSQDDTALRMTLLNPPSEVFAADCEPELQPGAPEAMKYLIARRTSVEGKKDLNSTFAAVIEPVKGKNSIQSSQALVPLSPNADFAGARVDYIDDSKTLKTDYILSGLDAKKVVKLPDGLEFAGQFGIASEDRLLLVNGTKLRYGNYLLEAKPVPAKIVSLNAATNEITLDALFPANTLAGKIVTISNSLHSTSYTIHSATSNGGKTVLNFGDVLPIVGEGHVTGVDMAKGTVTTDTVLLGHARVDGGLHTGRWLTDTKRQVTLKIKKFSGTVFQLESKIPEGAFADGRFFIVDFGSGDKVEVPSIQSVQREANGQYRIQSTLPFTLTLPADTTYTISGQNKEFIAAKGLLKLNLDPSDFANGEIVLKPMKP